MLIINIIKRNLHLKKLIILLQNLVQSLIINRIKCIMMHNKLRQTEYLTFLQLMLRYTLLIIISDRLQKLSQYNFFL